MTKTLSLIWGKLSWSDRLLPVFIIGSIVFGILLSVYVPSSREVFQSKATFGGVSIPLAMGLIVMMIPPLCKVEWENLKLALKINQRLLLISLIINWIIGPLIMFGLAWMTLFDQFEYRSGIILIGLARCIAMVLVWNDLAMGNVNLCAILVLLNSILQLVLYAPYQMLFCYVLSGENFTLSSSESYTLVAKSVAIFLGIPIAIGMFIRLLSLKFMGKSNFHKYVIPYIAPWALIGLLYTIVIMFIERGHELLKHFGLAIRCFIPLIMYFLIMWFGVFLFMRWYSNFISHRNKIDDELQQPLCGCENWNDDTKWNEKLCRSKYGDTITQAFTAASNNFELSLAIAVSLYGAGSKQAVAATFGPLLEVPILLMLTFVALIFRQKFIWIDVDEI